MRKGNANIILVIIIVAIAAVAIGYYFGFDIGFEKANKTKSISTPNTGNEKANLIKITSPRPNEVVTSPLTITGEARGTWYFEADFPVRLINEDGNQITVGIAQAQGEWMTEDFVPFIATLAFDRPSTAKGTLVLEKSNPSDLPENSDSLRVPIRFE